ncbi:hypothetical protein ACR3K2_36020 [Cryptosporidium serpentis]
MKQIHNVIENYTFKLSKVEESSSDIYNNNLGSTEYVDINNINHMEPLNNELSINSEILHHYCFSNANFQVSCTNNDRILFYVICHPLLYQIPRRIYYNRKDCFMYIGISLSDYLKVDPLSSDNTPMIYCNGYIIIKFDDINAIITATHLWIFNPDNSCVISICENIVTSTYCDKTFIYDDCSSELNFNYPTRESSSLSNICNILCHECKVKNSDIYIDTENNDENKQYSNITRYGNMVTTKEKQFTSLKNDKINYDGIKSINEEIQYTIGCIICEKVFLIESNINSHLNRLNQKDESKYPKKSFAAICLYVILEKCSEKINNYLTQVRSEFFQGLRHGVKYNKWYLYPWRFTFSSFSKKMCLKRDVDTLEKNITSLQNCLKKIQLQIEKSYQKKKKFILNSDEWEEIILHYMTKFNGYTIQLSRVKSSINVNEQLSNLYLNFKRNEYMYTALRISLITLACSIASVITGLFGMNLLTGFEQDPIAWYIVAFGIIIPIMLWGIAGWFTGTLCKHDITDVSMQME